MTSVKPDQFKTSDDTESETGIRIVLESRDSDSPTDREAMRALHDTIAALAKEHGIKILQEDGDVEMKRPKLSCSTSELEALNRHIANASREIVERRTAIRVDVPNPLRSLSGLKSLITTMSLMVAFGSKMFLQSLIASLSRLIFRGL